MIWHVYWWAALCMFLVGAGASFEEKEPEKTPLGVKIVAKLLCIPLFILAWKALP